ncbi:GTP-binding protein [Streptomyces tubbatahanensis]|uniref:GTP-binding protein n=1 Tax=Streptomyces tubbatahanensis TaxID=2923272 RepID=A0ABY3XM25_9ACTN|nr:GTP-binding protein [Streptomyces tubbatahanensis]UNS95449.1 GTP-binding protein [Streptomyces tubbatahanensis]
MTHHDREARKSPAIPVTVLTGFLGAGKTTLVNHILTARHGQRVAVVENEFGDIPVDNDLVVETDEEIVEMANGCCLCCTARTDLIDILNRLARRGHLDRVLIETSGMADPNPIAQTFFVDEEVASRFRLDAVVTLVDAGHVTPHLDAWDAGEHHTGPGRQVADQIAVADRVVVNKTDLVEAAELDALLARLRGINATAGLVTSCHAEVDLDAVLGIGAFDLDRSAQADHRWLTEDESRHWHDPEIGSVSVEIPEELDRTALERWLGDLAAERGADLYRLKGIVALAGQDCRHVLQGVHRLHELRPGAPWSAAEPRRSRAVFIGRGLDATELTAGLRACAAPRVAAEA